MAERDEGFLSRWSRRKAEVREGTFSPDAPASAPAAHEASTSLPQDSNAVPLSTAAEPANLAALDDRHPQVATQPPNAPIPTLDDVQSLTAQSDYSVFMAKQVEPMVRNAAMKKLFHSDPHFNVMDGLDVYIDDYNKVPLLAKSELRQMMQARMLGLLDDELVEQDKPTPDPVPAHENADLQLQQHDAVEPGGVDSGAVEPDAPELDPHGSDISGDAPGERPD